MVRDRGVSRTGFRADPASIRLDFSKDVADGHGPLSEGAAGRAPVGLVTASTEPDPYVTIPCQRQSAFGRQIPMIEVELSRLDLKHAGLRISDPHEVIRLAMELEAQEELAPVLVVAPEAQPILIQGFEQVAALRRLGRDTVRVLLVPLPEQEALTWCYRQQQGRRPTAIEEGWLVQELHVQQGQPLAIIATGLGRSTSWVSRRLGLVRQLPDAVQEQIRCGAVSPHAAMRSLLPLARANGEAATKLARIARKEQLSTRELGRLCAAWRAGDSAQREELLARPRLYLRLDEHVSLQTRQAEKPALVRDFELLAAVARRARRTLCDARQREQAGAIEALLVVWPRVCGAFRELTQVVQEQTHVEP